MRMRVEEDPEPHRGQVRGNDDTIQIAQPFANTPSSAITTDLYPPSTNLLSLFLKCHLKHQNQMITGTCHSHKCSFKQMSAK